MSMKLVHKDEDLLGFINRVTYRCTTCGNEVTKNANNAKDIDCPRCRHLSKNNKEKTK